MGTVTTDLPFEETPPDLAAAAAAAVREQLQLDEDLVIADHVVVKAVTLAGNAGAVGMLDDRLARERRKEQSP
jgi:hypothetical protein